MRSPLLFSAIQSKSYVNLASPAYEVLETYA